MVKLKHKIKGFTIFESMVAIIIIMVVFGMSSVVIINVSSSGITKEKQNAFTLVNLLRNETLKQSRFIDETVDVNGLRLEKTILDYQKNATLKILLIKAIKEEKVLFETKELVLINQFGI